MLSQVLSAILRTMSVTNGFWPLLAKEYQLSPRISGLIPCSAVDEPRMRLTFFLCLRHRMIQIIHLKTEAGL